MLSLQLSELSHRFYYNLSHYGPHPPNNSSFIWRTKHPLILSFTSRMCVLINENTTMYPKDAYDLSLPIKNRVRSHSVVKNNASILNSYGIAFTLLHPIFSNYIFIELDSATIGTFCNMVSHDHF